MHQLKFILVRLDNTYHHTLKRIHSGQVIYIGTLPGARLTYLQSSVSARSWVVMSRQITVGDWRWSPICLPTHDSKAIALWDAYIMLLAGFCAQISALPTYRDQHFLHNEVVWAAIWNLCVAYSTTGKLWRTILPYDRFERGEHFGPVVHWKRSMEQLGLV